MIWTRSASVRVTRNDYFILSANVRNGAPLNTSTDILLRPYRRKRKLNIFSGIRYAYSVITKWDSIEK